MGSTNGKVEPRYNSGAGDDEFDGPVTERSSTDVAFLVIKILAVVTLVGLLGHCLVNSDLQRLFRSYDTCGNVCGRVNQPGPTKDFCRGGDFTDKKLLLVKDVGRAILSPKNVRKECVKDCNVYPNYGRFLNWCIPTNDSSKDSDMESADKVFSKAGITDFFNDVSDDLSRTWYTIVLLCLLALGLSILILIALRYFAAFVVWSILLLAVMFSVGASIFFWVSYSKKKEEFQNIKLKKGDHVHMRDPKSYQEAAIMFTILSVVIVLSIILMRRKIRLVAKLFKEASKASAAMPLIHVQPVWTFIAMGITLSLWLYSTMLAQSAGKLTLGPEGNWSYYKKDGAMKFTRWYNLFMMYWFVQFLIGCQHMVIAGSVATWYFTRNKAKLNSPISTSFKNLVRYHLGSVALGSLILALIQLIRTLVKMIEKSVKESENTYAKLAYGCLKCCLNCAQDIIEYLSRNAYIEIALFGMSFCQGGRQAVKMLLNNAMSVAAINTIGDTVLFMSKALVVMVTTLLAMVIMEAMDGLKYMWIPIALVALFSYFIAHCFITVYEMIIDTIFLCFCEDCELNDGVNKPYFMDQGLMDFVEDSKRVLKVGDFNQATAPSADK